MPDDTLTPAAAAKRGGRWLKPALIASLALNLAVAGMVAGAAWRHGGPGGRGGDRSAPGGAAAAYMRALPPDDRRALRDAMRGGPGDRDSRRAERGALQAEVLEALRASPFDAEALRVAVARQTEAAGRMQEVAREAWLAQVMAMSDAARAAYADAVEDHLRHRGPHGRGRD